MRRIASFFINTNLFIAMAAVFMTIESQIQLGLAPSWHPYLFIIFFATLFEYNLHRLVILLWHRNVLEQSKHSWLKNNIPFFYVIMGASIAGFTIAICLAKKEVLVALFPIAVLTVFYSIPFFRSKTRAFRLRDIPGLKVFMIGAVWALVTVFLPIIQSGIAINWAHVSLILLERFLFITAITIPFDIRDMEADRKFGLRTIPIIMGKRNALALANKLTLAIIPICLLHYPSFGMTYLLAPMLISVVCTMYFLNSEKLQAWFYYHYGVLDGSIILQALLVIGYWLMVNG